MLGTVVCAILFCFLLWLSYWYLRVRHFEKYLKSIPGPTPLPLIGNALEFASATTILPTMMKYYRKFGGNFKIYIGSQPFVLLTEAKDLEILLNSPIIIRKSDPYQFLHNWLGTGLLTSWGDKWRKHRKIITPAFHFKILEEFVDVFNSAGDIFISKLREESKKESVDIYPFVTRCALDIICETAMGASVNAQDDINSEYVKCVNTLLRILMQRAFSPFLMNDILYRFSSSYQEEQRALKVVHGYSRAVLNKRKEEFVKLRENEEPLVDAFGRKRKKAFLDLLLEYSLENPDFTDEDIRQEVDTFMFEGHDTTATSISFALFSLATNPEVQKKAYSELQLIFADNPSRSATYQDLQEMHYLELVIKESLRIYTTIPMIGRAIEKDTKWNDNLTLPKGTMVNALTHAIHHSNFYEDSENFNPERFTAENLQGKNPFTYLPFSAGFRNCIGQKFAILEMKSTISKVLRNFELFPVVPEHTIILTSDAVLKSANGMIIKLTSRF